MKIKLNLEMDIPITPEIKDWLEIAEKELNRRLKNANTTTLTRLAIYGAIELEA